MGAQEEKKKRKEQNYLEQYGYESSLIHPIHQTTDQRPWKLREHPAGKMKTITKLYIGITFSNYRKTKMKKKIMKEAKGTKHYL